MPKFKTDNEESGTLCVEAVPGKLLNRTSCLLKGQFVCKISSPVLIQKNNSGVITVVIVGLLLIGVFSYIAFIYYKEPESLVEKGSTVIALCYPVQAEVLEVVEQVHEEEDGEVIDEIEL